MDICQLSLRLLKEKGTFNIRYIPGKTNDLDLFMKNMDGPTSNCRVMKYCGEDEYH